MDVPEIETNKRIFASENNTDVEHVMVISKSELAEGREYQGNCRNSNHAMWNGKRFEYYRYKFGSWYKEEINHFEDDDGYDVFVPMKIIKNENNESTN